MNLIKTILTTTLCLFLMIVMSAGVFGQRKNMSINRTANVKKAESIPEVSNTQERSASLEETTNLLGSMIKNDVKVVFFRNPDAYSNPTGLQKNEVVIKGCSVNLRNKHNYLHQKIAFQFNDIEPTSIDLRKSYYNHYVSKSKTVAVNSYTLSFKSLGMQKLFAYTDNRRFLLTREKEYRGSILQIAFPRNSDSNIEESETAERFETALKHAVKLCGGKVVKNTR